MAILRLLSAAAVLAMAGCVGVATNQAEVYKPIGGVIEMQITIPPGESFTKVQFQADDEVISEDTDPTDGFKAEVDTTEFSGDALVKLAAVGVRPNGSTVVLRENFILVSNPSSEPKEDETASGDENASGDGTATN